MRKDKNYYISKCESNGYSTEVFETDLAYTSDQLAALYRCLELGYPTENAEDTSKNSFEMLCAGICDKFGWENKVTSDVPAYTFYQILRMRSVGAPFAEVLKYEKHPTNLEFIADAYERGDDYLPYLKEGFDFEQAACIVDAEAEGINLLDYVDKNYTSEHMREILEALEDNADVTPLLDPELPLDQVIEIREEISYC